MSVSKRADEAGSGTAKQNKTFQDSPSERPTPLTATKTGSKEQRWTQDVKTRPSP